MAVKLTYHGHASWTIESGDTTLLIDPFLTDNPLADIGPDQAGADYILISHAHGDHLGDAVAIAKRTGATVISNFEIATYCQNQGVQAHPLHIGGGYDFPFGRVKLTIAHHGSSFPDGSYGGNPCGFLIKTGGKTIYDAADTGLFYDMKLIGELDPVDVALLPIGDNFTMGPDDALYAVKLIQPRVVIPMHYGTFDVIQQDPHAFARRVEAETEARCIVLEPGESYAL
ncbi:MAG TPA: metal-dependent hydrolase [Anaerolineae bacterium]|nr:metal-dependent hydrolase [Anaerolineae bacterium]